MVLAYSSFGHVDPRTGLQVNFPYTDRYEAWAAAVQYVQPSKRGTLSQYQIDLALNPANEDILADAYRVMIGGEPPASLFGTRETLLIDLDNQVSKTITGADLVFIDQAFFGSIDIPVITQDVLADLRNNILPQPVQTMETPQTMTNQEIPYVAITPYQPVDLEHIQAQGGHVDPIIPVGIGAGMGIILLVLILLFFRRKR